MDQDQDRNTRPRRGRPPGANRKPLDLDERKKRNATYEKDRRVLIGKGISRLEEFVGANANTPRAEVIARTINFIVEIRESMDELRVSNAKLLEEIAECGRKIRAAERRYARDMASRAHRCHEQPGGSRQVTPKPVVKVNPEPQIDPHMFEPVPEDPEPGPSLVVPVPLATPEAPVDPSVQWLEESPISLMGDEQIHVLSLFPDLERFPRIDPKDPPIDYSNS